MVDYPQMNYYEKFPDLVIKMLEYYGTWSNDVGFRSVYQFCHDVYGIDEKKKSLLVSPDIVLWICERLQEVGLRRVHTDLGISFNNKYYFPIKDEVFWNSSRDKLSHYYNSIVFGNRYIYNFYKDKVLPVVIEKKDGKPDIGTCFRLNSGLVTARHCLTDANAVSIRGITKSQLESSQIYVSKDNNIDIAYIELNYDKAGIWIDDPKVLDDVLVFGYPRIPGFIDFLAVEKATVSSIEEYGFVKTQGSIASISYEYLSKMEAMLITARIRGGNSGSPVINQQGLVVGIACHLPESEGDCYDEVGYGVSVPATYIYEMIDECNLLTGISFEECIY